MAAAPISYLGQVAGTTHNPVQSVNDHNQRLAADVAEPKKLRQQAPADEKAGWPPQELGNVVKGPAPDVFSQRTNRARSYSSLEELDQRQEDPRILQRRPSYDGLVSSSSSRKDEEQQKFNELQEQEQAQALAATLQVVNVFLCYYAQSLCYYRQTHGTSPTSVSGFNNTIITGDVNISNTITNNDVSRPKTTSGEKGDVLPHYFTRTFRSGLVWGSGTVLTALCLIYAAGSLVYYQRALPERFPVN